MAFNNVIPAFILDELTREFQPSLAMYIPRYRIREEFLTSVPDELICEQSDTGTNWSSHGTVDHPSFARLRTHLGAEGYTQIQRGWSNGDRVLKQFYLNDVLFKKGDTFFSADAMKYKLEQKND